MTLKQPKDLNLGINLPKEVYSENDKTLKKETEDDTNKWKDIPCS